MAPPWGRITAAEELIQHRYDPQAFVGRAWLVDAVARVRDRRDGRHLLIVGEPGSGKSAFIAYLADKWNCPRHFIRGDSIGGVLGLDPRAFLVSLGAQLCQKYGRQIFEEASGKTEVKVGWAKDQAEVVGRFIEQLYSLPFLPPRTEDVRVLVGVATGESRIVGERIAKLVDVAKALDEFTLLHVAMVDPLLRLQRQHPGEVVVLLIDALDESLEHSSPRITDILPRAADAEFPANLRIVMTSRPGNHLASFRKEDLFYLDDAAAGYQQKHQDDVRAYINKRLTEPPLEQTLAGWQPGELEAYVRDVEQNSDWNYLYLFHYFNEVTESLAKGQSDPREITIPKGLDETYRAFAVEKIRRNPVDQVRLTVAGHLSESFIHALRNIEGILHFEVDGNHVVITTHSADKLLLGIYSVASANRGTIETLETQRGTELGVWEEKYLPVLGVLAVAYEPLSGGQLDVFAGVGRAYVDSIIVQLRQFLDVVQSDGDDYYRLYHKSFSEYLLDETRNRDYPVGKGADHLISCCWNWSDLPSGVSRDYVLRWSLDHLLNRDLADKTGHSTNALELCRRNDGSFLDAAVRRHGVQRATEAMGRILQSYLAVHLWSGVAGALVHLRALADSAAPLPSALALLDSSRRLGAPETWLASLEAVHDGNMQRTIALAALARLAESDEESVEKLLDWLKRQQTGTMTLGVEQFDSECLRALLRYGDVSLAEKLTELPLYSSRTEQLAALALVWARNPRGSLRQKVLENLTRGENTRDSFSPQTLHAIASLALKSTDDEVLLEALRLIGAGDVSVQVEELGLSQLLARPKTTILESIRRLRTNVRLQEYPSLRASVAGLALLGTGAHDVKQLQELTDDLSQAMDAGIAEILCAMARYSSASVMTYSMPPPEFYTWLAARVSLLRRLCCMNDKAKKDVTAVNALRKFVREACTAIRWVAAQAEISDANWDTLGRSIAEVSRLVWSDLSLENSYTPFRFSGPGNAAAEGQVDPIRVYAIADTLRWLASEGWPVQFDTGMNEDFYRSSLRDVARLVFSEKVEAHLTKIEQALLAASKAPTPVERGSLAGSPWLEVFRAIASSAGESWRTNWTTNLDREDTLPDHLKAYLTRLRERVAEVADEIGFHPGLLELSYYLAYTTGEQDATDDEMSELVLPWLANMDASSADLVRHHLTWPPSFAPLLFARTVPNPLARAAASLELCDRGMLWQLAWDMSKHETEPAWQQSIAEFRDVVRREIKQNPHPRIIWYERDKSPETFVEAALAPINLLLDSPPRKRDFDVLADEGNADPESSCLRLKELLGAHPRAELLRWAVDKFSSWKSEHAMWIVEPLLKNREWSLLHQFLSSQFLPRRKGDDDRLAFRVRSSSESVDTVLETDWRAELEQALGLGPEEGLIYRLGELAQQSLKQALFQDGQLRQYYDKVKYADNWQGRVRETFRRQSVRRDEFLRTLLVIALLRNDGTPALLADELVASTGDDELKNRLVLDFAWVGRAVCSRLANNERLAQIAASRPTDGLAVLASLERWDLVRQHLEACARSQPRSVHDRDPLLQWYRQCASLPSAEQQGCLAIFEEGAPLLLAQRPHNATMVPRRGSEALLPVDEVSETLRFDEWRLSEQLLPAARAGDVDRLKLWFKALLIEAKFGPKRGRELDCFATLCRCAGILVSVSQERRVRDEWLKAVKGLSSDFSTRELWHSFFGGAGMALGTQLGKQLDRWYEPTDIRAVVALGEALASYADLDDAREYWNKRINEHRSPWLALRACGAFISRARKALDDGSGIACQYASISWTLAQDKGESSDPKFLAQLVECSVISRCSSVLLAISGLVADDAKRAVSIGRIALDSYLASLSRAKISSETQQHEAENWTLQDFLESRGVRELIATMIEDGAKPAEESEDVAPYQRSWHKPDLQRGIQWIAMLLDVIAKTDRSVELLRWISKWIKSINPIRDKDWQVAGRISKIATGLPSECRGEREAFLDFAIESAATENGPVDEQDDLVLDLLRARYRVEGCLAIVDRSLEKRSRIAYVDKSLAEIAAVCAELFPNDESLADKYLKKMRLPADKAVAADIVAEKRNKPWVERLVSLNRAPQDSQVVQRVVDLCKSMVDKIPELSQEQLTALGGVLVRLIPGRLQLYRDVGARISPILSDAELAQVSRDQERLRSLVARNE